MPQDISPNQTPPYMSFGVFTKSIETLADTTVPTGGLDRRVFSMFSGADYGTLIPGLRFLGLIDEERKATTEYRELVQLSKEPAKFKARLLEIVTAKYKPIIGTLNLQHGTAAQIEKAFKEFGVPSGQMLTKTIRFYLKALTECGFKLSPYITARKPRTANPTSKKNETDKSRPQLKKQYLDLSDSMRPDEIAVGFERLPLPGMPNSFIQYPTNLTEAHCQILEAMVGVLRTSVKARTGEKEKRP
jgi:hypothetical protein